MLAKSIREVSYHNETPRDEEQPRRLACDRCRKQKLRCTRDRMDSESCHRCSRANLECMDRPPMQMGRRNKHGISDELATNYNRRHKKQRSESTEASVSSTADSDDELGGLDQTEQQLGDQDLTAVEPSMVQNTNVVEWSDLSNLHVLRAGYNMDSTSPTAPKFTQTPINMEAHPDETYIAQSLRPSEGIDNLIPGNVAGLFDLTMSWDYAIQLDECAITSHKFSQPYPPQISASNDPKSPQIGNKQVTSEDPKPYTTRSLEHASNNHQVSVFADEPHTEEECVQMLWSLNSKMSKQLQEITSGLQKNTAIPNTYSDSHGRTGPTNLTSIGDVLTSSENFLDILRLLMKTSNTASQENLHSPSTVDDYFSFRSGKYNGDGLARPIVSHSPAAEIPRDPQIDTPTILLILTCHIRLIRLYSHLFSGILSSLPDNPSTASEPLPIARDLKIGDFQLKKYGGLQILIVLKIGTHLLHQVENLLELPNEYMVSGRENGSCVFRKPVSKKLIESIMAHEESKNCFVGKGVVESLRQSIKGIKQALKDG
ncbi:Zn2/Cys6 DNA-binding protein [Glarea lozoyensis ATCC 20868]|uniref:Zn2/Cys6 DNA-binding protein n=1 Tax=Glarea lozoyensis (strain ATCC 20868 / MF5171) TaxID=1116229 RepID=S3DP03_GLAL2|nr:Zn2/Cys6 DNA-binding protein [Glarea lozoyensis ATCC 20868]EPE33796.1 Zn2/Cys6 DNA-binding protein [Glarea lozoyensis ATCC 20868]